jgi:hypothetical protein
MAENTCALIEMRLNAPTRTEIYTLAFQFLWG